MFDRIEAGFLPIGHTHEDIDQLFSRTSERLRSSDCITLDDLHTELGKVYNSDSTVRHMAHVANWSGLCEKDKLLANITNFSQYRYFMFSRTEVYPASDLCTLCHVKIKSTEDWRPIRAVRNAPRDFLKNAPDLTRTPPTRVACPDGKEEVIKRMNSEACRIPSQRKLRELHDLTIQCSTTALTSSTGT